LVEHTNIQDNFGSGYTVKEYRSKKNGNGDDLWIHESIILKPLSDNMESKIVCFQIIGEFK
jgi:hypothetical protein